MLDPSIKLIDAAFSPEKGTFNVYETSLGLFLWDPSSAKTVTKENIHIQRGGPFTQVVAKNDNKIFYIYSRNGILIYYESIGLEGE